MEKTFVLIVESFIAVLYLFLVTKILGKKQISQLNIFDYIIGISLGNIAAEMSVNKEVTIIDGIITMTIYGGVSLFVSLITLKSMALRRFLTGTPIILIEEGKIIKSQLKKAKIDINDLLQEARENGYFDISEIEYAIMEVSGKVSYMPKTKYDKVTPNDLKLKPSKKSICANIVIDGKIMDENLSRINKDKKWLLKRLDNMKYDNIDDILLVTCNGKEELNVFLKNEIPKKDRILE